MKGPRTKPVAIAASLGAAGLGLFSLAAWMLQHWELAAFGSDYVPMAPITALLMSLLGVGQALSLAWPEHRILRRMGGAAAIFTLLVSVLDAGRIWQDSGRHSRAASTVISKVRDLAKRTRLPPPGMMPVRVLPLLFR